MSIYTPFSERDSVRVVDLLPGECNDTIVCEMFSAELESQPCYEALSYAWGDSSNTTPIVVNDNTFHVTLNLKSALRRLRRTDAKRPLWIDAICINQRDDDEKQRQVRIMATIFKRSSKVLIWLGEELDPLIREGGPSPMPVSEVFQVISNIADRKSIVQLVGDMPWDRWTPSFLDLLKRAWFKRLWVVQETAATPNPTLICGELSLPWDHLYRSHMLLAATLGITANGAVSMRAALQNLDALVNCWRLHQLWKDHRTIPDEEVARRLSLLLFSLQGNFLCSDERDRLYGLLGMIGHPDRVANQQVDYRISATDVFHSLAVFLLQSRNSLDILSGDRSSFISTEYPGKPSWVPTWSSYSVYTRRLYPLPHLWTASSYAEEKERPRADYRLSEDHRILYVKGAVVGGLVTFGTPPPYFPKYTENDDSGDEHRKALSQLLIMWETEVVHLPLFRLRQGEEAFEGALKEMLELWGEGIVHLPSLRESYATEQDVHAFRDAIFHSEEPGSRSKISRKECYEILLGRGDCNIDADEAVAGEVRSFSYFGWRNTHDMSPFRLAGGQFGLFEADMDIYQRGQTDIFIALFRGGPGPVVLCREESGYRYMGPCYVQGLEGEEAQMAFLDGEECVEFALI